MVEAPAAVVAAVLVLLAFSTGALCVSAATSVALVWARARPTPPARGACGVECPSCAAPPGRPCRRADGEVNPSPHSVRSGAAAGVVERDEDGAW